MKLSPVRDCSCKWYVSCFTFLFLVIGLYQPAGAQTGSYILTDDQALVQDIKQKVLELEGISIGSHGLAMATLGHEFGVWGGFVAGNFVVKNVGSWQFTESTGNTYPSSGISAGNFRVEGISVRVFNAKTGFSKVLNFSTSGRWGTHKSGGVDDYWFKSAYMPKAEYEKLRITDKTSFSFEVLSTGRYSADSFPFAAVKQFAAAQTAKKQASAAATTAQSGSARAQATPKPTPQPAPPATPSQNATTQQRSARSNNDALVEQGNQIRQQSDQTWDAYQEAQESISKAFDDGVDYKALREREAYEDELEWEERQRQQAANAAREKREQEQRRREADERARQERAAQEKRNAERDAQFAAKGGNANYKQKRSAFVSHARQTAAPIVRRAAWSEEAFNPFRNCSYASLIERIQLGNYSSTQKAQDIFTVIGLRELYQDMYFANARSSGTGRDDLAPNPETMACGNYLDLVGSMLSIKKPQSPFGVWYDSETWEWMPGLSNGSEYRNPNVELDNANILRNQSRLYMRYQFLTDSANKGTKEHLWAYFHIRKSNWSAGNFSTSPEKHLNAGEMQEEIDRYRLLQQVKRQHELTTNYGDFEEAIFEYHSGDYPRAFKFYKSYIVKEFGSFENFLSALKTSETLSSGWVKGKYDGDLFLAALLSAVLHMEYGQWDKSLAVLEIIREKLSSDQVIVQIPAAYQKSYQEPTRKQASFGFFQKQAASDQTVSHDSPREQMKAAIEALSMETRFRAGNYDSLGIAADKVELKKKAKDCRNHGDHWQDWCVIVSYLALQQGEKKISKNALTNIIKINKRMNGVYYASKPYADAFNTLVEVHYPKKKMDRPYGSHVITGYFLPRSSSAYDWHTFDKARYLLKNYDFGAQPEDIGNKPISVADLENREGMQRELNFASNREMLAVAFTKALKFYHSSLMPADNDTAKFLQNLIQAGIALGRFEDLLPLIFDLQDISAGEFANALQIHVVQFMTAQRISWRDSEVLEYFYHALPYSDPKLAGKNPHLFAHAEALKGLSPKDKETLQLYLATWSRFGFTSPRIPFFYTL